MSIQLFARQAGKEVFSIFRRVYNFMVTCIPIIFSSFFFSSNDYAFDRLKKIEKKGKRD